MQKVSRPETRIPSLDGVRGLAILFVIAVHLDALKLLPSHLAILRWFLALCSWGWVGVDLFFVLSGFLITDKLLEARNAANRATSFYARRALRIFPIYYLVLAVAVLACLLGGRTWVRSVSPTPLGFALYFAYLQNWWVLGLRDFMHLSLLGHFWSLAVEEQFYLLWPWIVWRTSARKIAAICAIGFITAFLLRLCLLTWRYGSVNVHWFSYMNTFTRMDSLLAGAFCAVAVRDPDLLRRVRAISPVLAASALAFFLSMVIARDKFRGDSGGRFLEIVGYSLFAVMFSWLVLAAHRRAGTPSLLNRFLSVPALTMLGTYSYGLYVYHAIAYHLLERLFGSSYWWGRSLKYSSVAAFAWLVVSFAVSVLSYELFEKPIRNLKHRFRPEIQRMTLSV